MYCGDGINDLIALGAADVGMTVGSSEASAAATISNRNSSIAGDANNNSNSRCQSPCSISDSNGADSMYSNGACTNDRRIVAF